MGLAGRVPYSTRSWNSDVEVEGSASDEGESVQWSCQQVSEKKA